MLNEGSEVSIKCVVVFQYIVVSVSSLTKRGQMVVRMQPNYGFN